MSRYQQQQSHPHPQQTGPQTGYPVGRRPAPPQGYGDDIDEAGGHGDELDTISLRDVASVRYVRHHEWMELILGSAVDTNKILPAKVIPESAKSGGVWQFDDAESIRKRVAELTKENEELEAQQQQRDANEEKKQAFYKDVIVKLREEFGNSQFTTADDFVAQLESHNPGQSVIDKQRIRKVVSDLGLPEPQKKDPAFDSANVQPAEGGNNLNADMDVAMGEIGMPQDDPQINAAEQNQSNLGLQQEQLQQTDFMIQQSPEIQEDPSQVPAATNDQHQQQEQPHIQHTPQPGPGF